MERRRTFCGYNGVRTTHYAPTRTRAHDRCALDSATMSKRAEQRESSRTFAPSTTSQNVTHCHDRCRDSVAW